MSRKRARIAVVLLWIAVPLLLLAMLLRNWLLWPAIVLMVVTLMIPTWRCPYCGKLFEPKRWQLGFHWSRPDEGYCRDCGRLLKYDDQK